MTHESPAIPAPRAGRRRALAGAAGLLAAGLGGCAVYNTSTDGDVGDLMLKGYDPVAYHTVGKPVKGDRTLRASFDGGTYYFASAQHRDQFVADPARYAPSYGGFCSNGAAYDMKAGGDIDTFKVYKGRLFIFGGRGSYDAWALEADRNIQRADGYWKAGLKDAPARWSYWSRLVLRVPHYRTGRDLAEEVERRRRDGTFPVLPGNGLQ